MKLLVISKNKSDLSQLEHMLHDVEHHLQLINPTDKGEIIQLLSENGHQLVFIEWMQQTDNSTPLIIELIERFPKIPFVVICDSSEENQALTSISDGVQDYFVRNKYSAVELQKLIKTSIQRENLRNELERARHEALEAVAYKDRMLERLSQKMRSPLNAITGMAELMGDTNPNSKQRFYTQIIREAGNNLVGLINDLLDFSKIEAGLININEHPFDLYNSITECVQTVLPYAIKQKLDLIYHVSPKCPQSFVGDDLRIRQILLNLLENAIKFTERGHIMLKVDYCKTEKPTLCFTVTDTGKGIEKEVIPTLFKPYTQLDEDTTGAGSGVGLGLAICKTLVEMMSGEISVESQLEKGSTFVVKLPLKVSDKEIVEVFEGGKLVPPPDKRALFMSSNHLHDELLKDYCGHWKLHLDIRHTDEDTPVIGSWINDYDLLISNIRESLKLDLKLIDRVRLHRKIPHILIKESEKANDRLTVIRKDTVILLKPLDMIELGEAIAMVLESKADRLNTTQRVPIPDEHLGEYHPLDILVADDNAINQRIVQGVLNRYGYQPKLVDNGLLTVEAAKERIYDVILLDIRMPVMSGIDATKIIREEISAENQPFIVALTTDALLRSRQQYLDAGMDEVLYKPVQTKKLVELLASVKRIPR
jgi:signal transduction histidine kinase/ActR/RegA family two-component response regulator